MSKGFGSPYFPPSTPRSVDGGIRAKSARGRIASTWWSTRFIEVLESTGMGGRLSRGRNYARRGQVIALGLSAGQVTASVQGSRARPYRVRIGITAYGKAEWSRVEERLAADAWFAAQLLDGRMPPDIEQIFADAGLTLFPSGRGDLALDCSCPDWEVPCKHLAAVFYLLAERFDDDPFLILAWRGRDRDDLLAHLGTGADAAADADAATPLTELLDVFYTSPERAGMTSAAATGASLLDQLPAPEVTVRGAALTDILRPVYDALRAPRHGEP
ncbi:SWIM zinc finger family protein [Agromyces bauzanensis]|uniref:SWIM-type domain-containing protein n=1 Tax=Agromyces bauzanensis TaxID=1308924 RepID=A0A917PW54_9MICO|nr:SWIM zinc finger family protein [Agromyces bauzanensis]GGJ94622.1 hypothetical protein GCM10011372_36180 [Agromyces bauzanensis]